MTRAPGRPLAGICVALSPGAMILSELFIIYLAAAAPFGVARFLSEHAGGARLGAALFRAAGAGLAWPLTSLPRLLRRLPPRGVYLAASSLSVAALLWLSRLGGGGVFFFSGA